MNSTHNLKDNAIVYIHRNREYQNIKSSDYSKILFDKIMSIHSLPFRSSDIIIDTYGKPHVVNNAIHFSISHSQDLFIVALSDNRIAVDCEVHTPVKIKKLAKRVFTTQELEYLNNHSDSAEVFFDIWCRKEAILKYFGVGFAIDPRSFTSLDLSNPSLHLIEAKTNVPMPKNISLPFIYLGVSIAVVHSGILSISFLE